ncbi:DUF7666 domain-containing protein [Massilia sp. PWRC2]|uniref:DUF7666 domain-containing protein n=1 Tax=Massilia sp. PWRC2 TaxID=2804626 RepID=UPI003CE935A3
MTDQTTPADDEVIVSYKGFDKDLKCRDFQFAVGETVVHEGEVKACHGGFHACAYPLNVFDYYAPAGNRFAVVEQRGPFSREANGDTKVASKSLTVKMEIGLPGLIKAAIEYTVKRCLPIDPVSPAFSGVNQGAASSTGDRGAASSTGDQGAASSTGYRGAASSTGYRGAASSTGYQGAASSTGDRGAASSTGYQGAASSTGDRGAASSTGTQGAASSTGTQGAASSTGYRGAASSTGTQGAASSTGDQGAASSTGDRGAASSTGKHSVAMACGYEGRAMAGETGAIVLCYRDDDYNLIHIRASKVGDNGIKAGVWYVLDKAGEFAEYEA